MGKITKKNTKPKKKSKKNLNTLLNKKYKKRIIKFKKLYPKLFGGKKNIKQKGNEELVFSKILKNIPTELKQKLDKLKLTNDKLAIALSQYTFVHNNEQDYNMAMTILTGYYRKNKKTNIKVDSVIETYNSKNLPSINEIKSKKGIIMCHSFYHDDILKIFFLKGIPLPSKNKNDYLYIDPSGLAPYDFTVPFSKKVEKYFPKNHFNFMATVFCPGMIYDKSLKQLIAHTMKNDSTILVTGFPLESHYPFKPTKFTFTKIKDYKPHKLYRITKKHGGKKKQKGGNGMCSPAVVKTNSAGASYNYSCFTLQDLKNMAQMVNKKYNANISINSFKSSDKPRFIREIHQALKCGNMSLDMCVVKNYSSDFQKAIKKNFKPKSPQGKDEWLSSIDIYDVMEQYMEKHPDFIFFGPVPIDWQDFSNALARINLKKLKNKKRIGIVFNTDPSHKSGEHWISMFIDLTNKTICFFDSVGEEPPKEVKRFMNKIIKQAKSIGLVLKPIINKRQHQKGNNECGVYSLYFITTRLQGKNCEYINNHIIKDQEMNKYRQKFFRPHI